MVARTLTVPSKNTCAVRMLNASTEPIRLWSGMTMGVLYEVDEQRPYRAQTNLPDIAEYNTVSVNSIETIQKQIEHDLRTVDTKKKPIAPTIPPFLDDLYQRSITELNEDQKKTLFELLCIYQDAFSKDSNDIGFTKWVKHDVNKVRKNQFDSVHVVFGTSNDQFFRKLSTNCDNKAAFDPALRSRRPTSYLYARSRTILQNNPSGECA